MLTCLHINLYNRNGGIKMQNYYSDSRKRCVESRFNILLLQVIFVAVVLVTAVVIRIFGGDVYREISSWYREKFNDITTTTEVLSTEVHHNKVEEITAEAELVTEETYEDDLFDEENEEIESSVKGYLTKEDTEKVSSVSVTAVNSIIWPASGKVTSEYGYRTHPISGKYAMHGGIDIGAEKGSPIKSVFDGKIIKNGYSNSYGYYVIISHGDNFETLYAHCSKLLLETGDEVKKGDTVALVGNTGKSTRPHLHFEIRIGGCRVDPRWLLGSVTDV